MISKCLNHVNKTQLCKWQSDATHQCERTKFHTDFHLIWTRQAKKIFKKHTTHCLPKNRGKLTPWKPKQVLNRQGKKLNANACGKKGKEKSWTQSLWQNYKERQNKTNTSVKQKMAALIRQANKWNQMGRWKGCWKWQRKIKEKEGGKKIHYSHLIKSCTW